MGGVLDLVHDGHGQVSHAQAAVPGGVEHRRVLAQAIVAGARAGLQMDRGETKLQSSAELSACKRRSSSRAARAPGFHWAGKSGESTNCWPGAT